MAFGWNNSSGRRGVLSSKTTSACHFEPKAVSCNKIGIASLPFSVSVQRTTMGDFFPSSMQWMNPSFCSSFKRIDRTLGVKPGMESRSRLNRSTPSMPISLSTSIVHFLPNTPKLVLIGHRANLTPERSHSDMVGYCFSGESDFCNILLLSCQFIKYTKYSIGYGKNKFIMEMDNRKYLEINVIRATKDHEAVAEVGRPFLQY